MKDYIETYETWTDAVNASEASPDAAHRGVLSRSGYSRSTSGMGSGWYGTDSWEEAIKLARYGWPDVADKIAKISNAVFEMTGSLIVKDDIQYDVTGSAIDIGAYLTGQPECFTEWVESDVYAAGKGKIVKMVVNISASGSVTADVLFMRGAALVALADSLERAGRRVEIWTADRASAAEVRIQIKRPEEPVQIDQIAFAMAHPAALRRIGFALQERFPTDIQEHVGTGYGRPETSEMTGDVSIPSAMGWTGEWKDEASTIKWVLTILAEQGIIINGKGD